MESGFVKSAMGAIEVAGGIWRATRGDVLGAAAGTIDGSVRIGEGVDDFKEAKQLFSQARDIERQFEFNEITPGCHDREY